MIFGSFRQNRKAGNIVFPTYNQEASTSIKNLALYYLYNSLNNTIIRIMLNKKLVKPILLATAIYLLSYGIPKLVVSLDRVHYIKLPIDDKLPLIKPFIIIYILAFVQWTIYLYILAKQDTKFGYIYASAIIIGSLIGCIIFLTYPSGVTRIDINELKGNSILDFVYKVTFSVDSIVNAIPSFHCFCSWLCFRGISEIKSIDNKWKLFNFIFSLLVFASTLFTKQHFILDIPAGILLAEFSIQIAKKYQLTKLFHTINKIGN